MVEYCEFSVKDILELQEMCEEKNKDKTLKVKYYMKALENYTTSVKQPEDSDLFILTKEQKEFIRYILPIYIRKNISCLSQVMKIYNMDTDTIFHTQVPLFERTGGIWD
jgi:hypothetical protein